MFKEVDFEDIRPYHDSEINQALRRIIFQPDFDTILDFLFPAQNKHSIKQNLAETYSSHDFQQNFMHPLISSIVERTSAGLTYDGFEHLTSGTPYLFIANHRDIVLDSAMLQVLLLDNGHKTTEITFGSNLMINQFIIDLGKVNRMFKVIRHGNKIAFLKNSQRLSAYIRHTLINKKVSIWISQRSGRTKNGNDKTETGLLKMLNMSARGDFVDSFGELNIVPVTVSYEYEPCCSLKIKELVTSLNGPYQKKPDEDFKSIITGITQPKGRIHMSIGKPLNNYLDQMKQGENLKIKINKLAERIDAEIYGDYKLWPNNYIAYDLLHDCRDYHRHYTSAEENGFLEYMEQEISGLTEERNTLERLFLKMYANPLINTNGFKKLSQRSS